MVAIPSAGSTVLDVPSMFSRHGRRQRLRPWPAGRILESRLTEFSGYYVAVDCQSGGCGGERTFAVSDLENFYRGQTLGRVLQRMRCSGCGGRVGAAWLVTGPVLGPRVRAPR